jgi:N6-L-threonylcarbamoyladenine synthase
MDKLKLAVSETRVSQIAIGGGVSANSGIRNALKEAESQYGWSTYLPAYEFTTDNAAMIAIVGFLKFNKKQYANQSITASSRLKI